MFVTRQIVYTNYYYFLGHDKGAGNTSKVDSDHDFDYLRGIFV